MKPVSKTTQDLLARARRRLNCFAVAFIAPEQQIFHFDSASVESSEGKITPEQIAYAETMLRRGANSFMTMSRESDEPIIRNRVRDAGSSSLLCRFCIVPVHDDLDMHAGVFVLYNPPNGVEFNAVDAAMATRLTKVFGKNLSLPRDALTKLLTRDGFERQVAMLRPGQASGAGVLLYGDIDQLHVVNDLFGFQTGDRVIAAVAQKLQTLTSSNEGVISRMSGDRFTIFLPNETLERGHTVASRMRDTIATMRFTTNDQPVQITLSLGVALLGVDGTLDHGLAAAEIACKAAKDRGRNRAEVYQEADQSIIRRHDDMLIVGRLRSALDEGRIQIFGQAITSLQKKTSTRRYEMLVRLIDENNKLVMPQEFMSSATRYQLLPQLDRHVISHVLRKIKAASVLPGFRPIQVSLNLSGPTISEVGFADWLMEQVQDCGVPTEWIGFELTENAAIANLERAQLLMERMGTLGCKFALDDFGTGVNSLAYLKALKLSMIKIDGSFIRDVLENERSESLVRGIAQLAKSMGIETVAEYVESPTICMRLIDLGVEYGQGYALEKPVLLDRILDPVRSLALAS